MGGAEREEENVCHCQDFGGAQESLQHWPGKGCYLMCAAVCCAVRFVRLQPASDLVGGAIETYWRAKSSKRTVYAVVLKTFTCLVDTVLHRNVCHVVCNDSKSPCLHTVGAWLFRVYMGSGQT